jgi:hypothetical protein
MKNDKFSEFVEKHEVKIAIGIIILMLILMGKIQATGEEWR